MYAYFENLYIFYVLHLAGQKWKETEVDAQFESRCHICTADAQCWLGVKAQGCICNGAQDMAI